MRRLSSDQGDDTVHNQTQIFCGSPLKQVLSFQPLFSPIEMSNLQHLHRGETSKHFNCRMLPCLGRQNRLLFAVSCLKWRWRASYSGKQDAVILSRFGEAYLSKARVLLVLRGFCLCSVGCWLLVEFSSCCGSRVQLIDTMSTPGIACWRGKCTEGGSFDSFAPNIVLRTCKVSISHFPKINIHHHHHTDTAFIQKLRWYFETRHEN